jgi:hypothetical protein
MWGSLVGILFMNPLIGLATGAALSGSNVSTPGTAGAASEITNPTSSDASATPSTAPAQGAAS